MTERTPPDLEREYLQAYFDGQLEDPAFALEIEKRIDSDPQLKREYEALARLRETVGQAERPKAPAYLRQRVSANLRENRKPSSRLKRWVSDPARLAAAAGLIFVLALGAIWFALKSAETPTPNLEPFVDHHIASFQSAPHPDEIESVSMENWFRERLDFAPNLPQWNWARATANDIHPVDGQRTAGVRYQVDDTEISLFVRTPVMPGMLEEMGALSPHTAMADTVRGYRVCCWTRDGLDYILVAPVNATNVFDHLELEA